MSRHLGAWIRYGEPLSPDQVAFAVEHYAVAILQPWEAAAAAAMKAARPDMTVLCYKCLASTRSYEPGPVYTSGVCHGEAEENGEHWFAHRTSGARIEWRDYPGHWQMAVWEPEYRERWVGNVGEELAGSPFDGVFADNDIFDDYYGLEPPLEGGRDMADLRAALGSLLEDAGSALDRAGKLLVPNIAESRREPGRWASHAAHGGGFEEMWLGYAPDVYFDPSTALAQMAQLRGPGLSIMRVPTDGAADHPNFQYGLAALWIFGGGGDAALSATAHDDYSGTPFVPELDWDLGAPVEEARRRGNGWSRRFTHGWAAVNLNDHHRRAVSYEVPVGLCDRDGEQAPKRVTLRPHRGVLYRSVPDPLDDR
jgi:Hypothetical glycosyl hydrolase family 15